MQEEPIANDLSVQKNNTDDFVENVKRDYKLCCLSREASMIARKEVLTGKAKFGIIGDGKELPQIAMARAFKKGDYRSGYYRDQTFMMAIDECTLEAFFAQLYADPENDPFSGGRQMNCHFATPMIDTQGNWLNMTDKYNVSSDISSTGGQMARALGLALASKKYRALAEGINSAGQSVNGNELSFVTIGDASTSEGVFWETMNAASVMQVPLVTCVWDDGYGISVPIDYQTTKKSISKALDGFSAEDGSGINIYTVKAWDYPALIETFEKATNTTRRTHVPALIHVQDVTQPQGHSTSGSHERYKSKERLEWEKEFDCISRMHDWIVSTGLATDEELQAIKEEAKKEAKQARDRAWKNFIQPNKDLAVVLNGIFDHLSATFDSDQVNAIRAELLQLKEPHFHEMVKLARRMKYALRSLNVFENQDLDYFINQQNAKADKWYHSNLYSETPNAALMVEAVPPVFSEDSQVKNGYEILNEFFQIKFSENNKLVAFGEDVGKIGDVNQGFAGLQAIFGEDRIFDTGIREWTIMGQALGLAMRGFRPIAEIQYLDYLIYGLQPLTDDLATLRYRSNGIQHAPAIIRSRGHRLEGIWHAGSPIGMLIHSLRGMYIMVPRNMVQAAGFYNTMLKSDDPGLIIECLNGYRLKETRPDNLADFCVPLGVPEILAEGHDITLVTYGSCVRIAEAAIQQLTQYNISVELIDVQTLLPFDTGHTICQSLKKTNRIVFLDEDVPGGASSYMLQQVLEVQGGYQYLDSKPVTITAHAHRPPYGSDGDYFTKPSAEDVFDVCYNLMNEYDPGNYPA
ncbi:MAG TPA: thiamine pyrophosphate-dependent enzyme [Saprospiraceae bacterium]|nr:thiamine pyrophosphate-dependent enzyme [Saprospiraceae bacterium]